MISPGNRYRPRKSGLALSIALIAALGVPMLGAQAAPGSISRESVATGGTQRDKVPTGSTTACGATTVGKCTKRTISGDGSRVVFVSRASNLVDGDTNGKADVFLWDNNATPKVKRINVGSGGAQANAESDTPSISPNGRYITFESLATNLGPDDNDLVTDVFIYDTTTNALALASMPNKAGDQSNQASFSPSVADDGSVSFTSFATNLTDKAPGQFQNVFVRKTAMATGNTVLVSQGGTAPAYGVAGDGPSKESTISADGSKVSFTSAAKNIAGTEAESTDDIFVATVGTSLTDIKRITTASGNDAQSYMSSLSPDGSKVAFVSDGIDADGRKDIFTATTAGGSPSNASDCGPCAGSNPNTDRPAVVPAITNSGAVAFQSAARFSPVTSTQIWVKNGNVAMASTPAGSTTGANMEAEYASISDNAQFVAFTSAANNLVPGDSNGAEDIFRKDMTTGELVRVSVGPNNKEASGFAIVPLGGPTISEDGRFVAFDSDSSNLLGAEGDKNGLNDIFYRDRKAAGGGETKRISNGLNGEESNGSSRNPVMSADGRYVVFESTASNLVANDTNGVSDVFIWDRNDSSINMLSKAGTMMGDQESIRPHISPNGQWVVFESLAAIAQPVFPGVRNVMRVNLAAGPAAATSPDLVSKQKNPKGGFKSVSQDSFGATVADSGVVAFLTRAKSLPTPNDPDTNTDGTKARNYTDVLATTNRDLTADFVRISQDNDGNGVNAAGAEATVANGHSTEAIISGDGSRVAFTSLATNLTGQQDTNPDSDVFVRDIGAGTTSLVSQGLGRSSNPSISRNGGSVAFVSTAANIEAGDTNSYEDVFVGGPGAQAVRMSMAHDGNQALNGGSYYPALSANGESVAFNSVAPNLVPDDTNDAFDTFVRDLNGFVPTPCPPGGCTGGGGGGGGVTYPAGTAYRFVAADGGIFNFGDAKMFGSLGGMKLNKPIVAMAATPSNQGYWLVASDGGIFSFGDAGFHGSTGAIKLNSPIVAMASTPSGKGYWFVAADGGIFGFGDAAFHGSMGGKPLNRPIVAMAPTASGKGYWLVASDGGIFSFGDAAFFGSTGAISLNKPIVGMDRTASGKGYRFVASDGGIFSFGDASFLGSMGDKVLNKPIVGMAKGRSGDGYYLVASDGGIFAFGSAPFAGSTGNIKLNSPIVGMAG